MHTLLKCNLINRPCVARAVLQTPLLVINWVSHPLWKYLQQTFIPKPEKLGSWTFERRLTFPHLSCVRCHMSCVRCHMLYVTFQMSHIKCPILMGQSGEASQGRVCYQLGLPRLVSYRLKTVKCTFCNGDSGEFQF